MRTSISDSNAGVSAINLIEHPHGGSYGFLTGIAPYSSGVVAHDGFVLHRIVFSEPIPYAFGIAHAAEIVEGRGRPVNAICAMELRIPKALTFTGFAELNYHYRVELARHGLLLDAHNPIARTNVAPTITPPDEAALYAFTYTVPHSGPLPGRQFVVAGAGDLHDQAKLAANEIVRPGELSESAVEEKISTVMDVMNARLVGLGASWADVNEIGIYTSTLFPALLDRQVLGQAGRAGADSVHWYPSTPPIQGLFYEMDLRGIHVTERYHIQQ